MSDGWFSDASNIESILAILTAISVKLGVIVAAVQKYLKNRKDNKEITGKDLVEIGVEIGKSLSCDAPLKDKKKKK